MKKVKFALPILAAAFAVVGAFATSNAKSVLLDQVTDQTNCTKIGTCSGGEPACKNGNTQLYIRSGSPISCTVAATGTFVAD